MRRSVASLMAAGLFSLLAAVPAAAVTLTDSPLPAGVSPAAITLGPDGREWFAISSSAQIGRVPAPFGSAATLFPLPVSTARAGALTAGPGGNIWYLDYGRGKVGRVTTAGVVTEFDDGQAVGADGSTGAATGAIAAGADGNLWYVAGGGVAAAVYRMTPAGAVTKFTAGISSSPGFVALSAGPDASLWAVEAGANKIARITTAGAVTQFTIPTASSGTTTITPAADGNLWFTENAAGKVAKITPAGTITEFSANANYSFDAAAEGPDGYVWFADSFGAVGRITTSGAVTEYTAGLATGAQPAAVAPGPDGAVWFTESQGRLGHAGTDAPAVSTDPAANIAGASADLAGHVNPNGRASTSYFEYGSGTAYGQRTADQAAGSGATAQPFTTAVTGLSPSTTYHYRAVATSSGGTSHGADRTFTTTVAGAAPQLTGFDLSGYAEVAKLFGTAWVNNAESSYTASIDWGDGNQSAVTASPASGSRLAEVGASHTYAGPGTYSVTTRVTDAITGGSASVTSKAMIAPTYSITTGGADTSPPGGAILKLSFDDATGAHALVGFEYGPTTRYGSKLSAGPPSGVGIAHHFDLSATLVNLHHATTYHYRAYAVTPHGTIYGQDASFTTNDASGLLAFDCTVGICVADDDGSNSRPIALAHTGLRYFNPKWSPDGKQIAFQGSDGNLYLTAYPAGTTRQLSGPGDVRPLPPCQFANPDDLYKDTLNLLFGSVCVGSVEGLAWSPDGSQIYWDATGLPGLGVPKLIDVGTGHGERLLPNGWYGAGGWSGAAWSGHDSRVITTAPFSCVTGGDRGGYGLVTLPSTPQTDAKPEYGQATQQERYLTSTWGWDPAVDESSGVVFFTHTAVNPLFQADVLPGHRPNSNGEIAVVAYRPVKSTGVDQVTAQGQYGQTATGSGICQVASPPPSTVISSSPRYDDEHAAVGGEGLFFDSDEEPQGGTKTPSSAPLLVTCSDARCPQGRWLHPEDRNIWAMTETGGDRHLVIRGGAEPDWYPAPGNACTPGVATCCPPENFGCNRAAYQLDRSTVRWGQKVRGSGDPYESQTVTFTNESHAAVSFGVPAVTGGTGLSVVGARAGAAAVGPRPPGCARGTIEPRGRCGITVRFDTRTPGTVHAVLGLHESGNPGAAVELVAVGRGFAPAVRRARIVRRHGRPLLGYRLSGRARIVVTVEPAVSCGPKARKAGFCPSGLALVSRRAALAAQGTLQIPLRAGKHRLPAGPYIVIVTAIAPHWSSPATLVALRLTSGGGR